jgi:hypothetical protein
MDLEQFIKAKRELERSLALAIQAEIEKFEQTTGRTPIFVDVEMEDVTQVGSAQRKFIVESVRTDIPLE